VSGLAVSFLLWLLYVHHASADFAGRWMFLPALNALLNGLCAIALCVGLYFIKHHNREAHRTSMLLAFAFSSAFLVSYIVNHALHGDTIFPGHGPVRTLYLSILASHVILSIVALPMVLTTFFFSLTGRFMMHRQIARLAFPEIVSIPSGRLVLLCDAVPKEKIHIERSVIARAQPFLHDLQVDQKLRTFALTARSWPRKIRST
jgi:putative membrane protein